MMTEAFMMAEACIMPEAVKFLGICSGSHKKWTQAGVLVPDGRAIIGRSYRLGWWERKRKINTSDTGSLPCPICPEPPLLA